MNKTFKHIIAFTGLGCVPFASATFTTLSVQSIEIYPVFGAATHSRPAATGLFTATYDASTLQATVRLALQNQSHLDLSNVFILDPRSTGTSTLTSLDGDWVESFGIRNSRFKFNAYLGLAGAGEADDYLAARYVGKAGFSTDVEIEWSYQYDTLGEALFDFSNLGNLADAMPDIIVTWGQIAPLEYFAKDFKRAFFYNKLTGSKSDWGTFDLTAPEVSFSSAQSRQPIPQQAAIPEPSAVLFGLTSALLVGIIGRRRR